MAVTPINIALAPQTMKQVSPTTLGITWNDGHESTYAVRNIRLSCRCANCIDEWTREKILKAESVPEDIKPKKIETVGRYAIQINWSDGHSTGIFTFEQLRSLCECESCQHKNCDH